MLDALDERRYLTSPTAKRLARKRPVEQWLADRAGPAYDALKADPSRAVSIAQVRKNLQRLTRPP